MDRFARAATACLVGCMLLPTALAVDLWAWPDVKGALTLDARPDGFRLEELALATLAGLDRRSGIDRNEAKLLRENLDDPFALLELGRGDADIPPEILLDIVTPRIGGVHGPHLGSVEPETLLTAVALVGDGPSIPASELWSHNLSASVRLESPEQQRVDLDQMLRGTT